MANKEQCTQKYWEAAHAWNTSTHKTSKLTVQDALGLLNEASQGSPRLLKVCDSIRNQIVHKQVDVVRPRTANVKEIGGV